MPKISVIIPFYNAGDSLDTAVKSIQDQTFKDFECILINNNSTDRSFEIAQNQTKKDSRFKLVCENKQGVAHASNKGSQIAQGEYIARMDADDVAFPKRIELQYKFLRNNADYGAVGGLVTFGGHPEQAAGIKRFIDWNNKLVTYDEIALNRFIELPIINPTAMWKKSTEAKSGNYTHGNFPEDYELWLRWLDDGVKIAKIKEPVLQWNDPPDRLTRTDDRYRVEAFYDVKSQYLYRWLEKNNIHYPNVYIWGASRRIRHRAFKLKQYGIKILGYIDVHKRRQIDENVIFYKELPPPENSFILVYMPHHDIKKEIAEHLHLFGYIEGINYIFAA